MRHILPTAASALQFRIGYGGDVAYSRLSTEPCRPPAADTSIPLRTGGVGMAVYGCIWLWRWLNGACSSCQSPVNEGGVQSR